MNKETKVKGISLIVLVITIIIIIIMAGAVILSLSNSGIIDKAKIAKQSNDFVAIREATEMEKSNAMSTGTDFNVGNVNIPSSYSDEIGITSGGTIIIKQTPSGTTSKITDISDAITKLNAVYIPRGFVASTLASESSKEKGLVIKEGTDGSLANQNEFVWVPVENYSNFKRESFHGWPSTNENFISATLAATKSDKILEVDTTPNQDTVTGPEALAMYQSVKTYHGFYIARYEAGDSAGTTISKKNVAPNQQYAWGQNGTDQNGLAGIDSFIEINSRSMYPSNGATGVISSLVYGVQWDAIVRWYKSSGINISDSTSYGNYKSMFDSNGNWTLSDAVINTGSNDQYKVNNIYDLAGNLWEWTMEAYGATNRMLRGGGIVYQAGASGSPVADRSPGEITYGTDYSAVGFRVALYIK